MSACSTPQSTRQQVEITTRDVTAVCPAAPEPVIDRSFAAEPPACGLEFRNFRFSAEDIIAGVGVQAADTIARGINCLAEIDDWIDTEREARDQ